MTHSVKTGYVVGGQSLKGVARGFINGQFAVLRFVDRVLLKKPKRYSLADRDRLDLALGSPGDARSLYRNCGDHIESLRSPAADTAEIIDQFLSRIGEALLQVTDIYPIRFESREVAARDGLAEAIVMAHPAENPVLEIGQRDYYFLRATFSVGKPSDFERDDVTALRLSLDLGPDTVVRSLFPNTHAVALAANHQEVSVGIDADASFAASQGVSATAGMKAAAPEAAAVSLSAEREGNAAIKAKASAGWVWKSSYVVVGHPVVARRLERGAEWRFHHTSKVASAGSASNVIPLAGNDIGLMLVFGVPKGQRLLPLRGEFTVEFGGDASEPREFRTNVPLRA